MFEGQYLYNYKIKGKDYIKGKLEYEGDYFYENKYNGKGYDENGNIIYELIDGCGTIIECFHDNLISYIGEYKDGIRNGKGKEYSQNGKIKFDSEYSNSNKNRDEIYEKIIEE